MCRRTPPRWRRRPADPGHHKRGDRLPARAHLDRHPRPRAPAQALGRRHPHLPEVHTASALRAWSVTIQTSPPAPAGGLAVIPRVIPLPATRPHPPPRASDLTCGNGTGWYWLDGGSATCKRRSRRPSGRHWWDQAGVAQLAAQAICNRQVGGSSPSASSTKVWVEGEVPRATAEVGSAQVAPSGTVKHQPAPALRNHPTRGKDGSEAVPSAQRDGCASSARCARCAGRT
jgi:hypothetical protein